MGKTKDNKYQSIFTSMNIHKYLLVSVISLVIFFGLVQGAEASCTGSSPTWNCNTSTCAAVSDLNNCINGAKNGDTIIFATGTYNYSGSIILNKPVSIIGAGIGNSIITGGSTISMTPSSYADTVHLYRVSGFTFTGGRSINRLGTDYWNVTQDMPALPKVRIDHNRFIGKGAGSSPQFVYNSGTMQGVIDNNIIEDYGYPVRNLPGVDYTQRALQRYQYIYPHWDTGNDYVIMFEDNIFTGINYGDGSSILADSGVGGVYAFRYNTITPAASPSPLFDYHGYTSGQASSFGAEIYGNLINASSGSLVRARGGKGMIHHNSASSSYSIEFYSGISSGDTNACPAQYTVAQMMHDTYSFLNRVGLTGSLLKNSTTFTIGGTCLGLSGIPKAGRDYFGDSTSLGVSCGIFANLPGTCTIGEGYWATNQSCTNLTGMVGTNPETPISGTLYKCTSANTWTAFYTPLIYPHPLRNEELSDDTTPPSAITNLSTSNPTSNLITLTWTSPGDDGNTGTASSYDIRYSTSNITKSNWSSATRVNGQPSPLAAGTPQSMIITGLLPNTAYYFAIRTSDEVPNVSDLSNVPSATTAEAPSGLIEAESGNITPPMQKVLDNNASGGEYIQTITADSGTAIYTFNIPIAGIYKIIAMVYAAGDGADSLYFKIDSQTEDTWDFNPSANDYGVWREDELTKRGTGTFDNPQYDPYTLQLTQGNHTLTFRGREANAKLDYFRFVQATTDTTPPAAPSDLTVN